MNDDLVGTRVQLPGTTPAPVAVVRATFVGNDNKLYLTVVVQTTMTLQTILADGVVMMGGGGGHKTL